MRRSAPLLLHRTPAHILYPGPPIASLHWLVGRAQSLLHTLLRHRPQSLLNDRPRTIYTHGPACQSPARHTISRPLPYPLTPMNQPRLHRGMGRLQPKHRGMCRPVHWEIAPQRRAHRTSSARRVAYPDWPQRRRYRSRNATRPLRPLSCRGPQAVLYRRSTPHTEDRMHSRAADTRPMQDWIIPRRQHNIYSVPAVATVATPISTIPRISIAATRRIRSPAPAKRVPVRPAAATERCPSPRIRGCPQIPATRIPDPAAIAIRVEARIIPALRLPDTPLSRNVVPAPIRIQIRPPIPLIPGIAVTRRRLLRRCICCRLIARFIPLVPRIGRNLLRQKVPASLGLVAAEGLPRMHIGPVSSRLLHMRRSVEHGNRGRPFVQIHPHGRILRRRH